MDAASLVAKRGYTNVMVFRDGLPAWIKAGYPINSSAHMKGAKVTMLEAKQLNASLDDLLVVDIRPQSAYKFGYLPGSRAMPLTYLSMLSVELPKNSRMVVVDHNGKQGKTAAQWLKNKGFTNVSWLKGGLSGYVKAGFKLEK